MWSPLVVCLVVGLASAEYAWKPNTEYKYQVKARTLAALHQVANDYVGVLSHATLTLQPTSSDAVFAWLSDAQYSPVQLTLPGGWASWIPEKELSYKSLPLSSKPFQIKFKNGVVDGLVVSKDLSNPEVNFIKSVVSQLQVDTRGTNEIKWPRGGQAPKRTTNNVFRAMEDTVTGQCEVMYDISALPMYAVQVNPELVPLPNLIGDGRVYDIVKTKNFSNCDKKVVYHFGFTGLSNWEPASNKMGHFFSRSGISRIAISGSLEKYTIQSSVTVNKIVLSPAMYNAQKGMVSSRMNVTLVSVRPSSNSPPSVPNPKHVKDLVYEYNDPFSSKHSIESGKSFVKRSVKRSSESSSSSGRSSSSSSIDDSADSQSNSQDSSSSSSSSETETEAQASRSRFLVPNRFGRSAPRMKKNARSGNSNSSSENDIADSVSSENGSSSSSERENSSNSCRERSSSQSSDSDSSSSNSDCFGHSPRLSSRIDEDSSGNDSSSLSSSEEHNPRPLMDKPPKIPLLPYFIGYQGSSIHSAKNLDPISAVKKLCSQIASELQNPGSIPQTATLAKFSIVARLIRTMSTDQLQKATSQIYSPIKPAGYNPWPVLRDAVATAGTGPCLSVIMEWIKTKKVSQGEAAEIVATLAAKARAPTAEFMKNFFGLATSPEVTKQPLLNSTTILSFANLACKAQVSKTSARRSFPVHALGQLSPINPKAVTEEYIPYMAKHLRAAVKDADSHKIQVYIQALGNLGHPKILSVFEPFLEGKEPMSTFQRTLMVASLNKLSKVYPQIARRVLFNVYQNLGEAHEVRCAAVIVLMRTAPPTVMLQRMAEFTNRDPSIHVTSLVQSLIRSAANLQAPEFFEIKRNAQAAVHLLSPKPTGVHQSGAYIRSYMVKEMGLAYRKELSWIGSSDGIIPSSAFLSIRQNIGGWKSQGMMMSVMTSSINDLADALSEKFGDTESHGGSGNRRENGKSGSSQSPFTMENIAEMLKIVTKDKKPVEGNLLFSHLDSNRFLTFDNATVDNLPTLLQEAAQALRSGYHYNYNKLFDRASITLAFPTETSLPFVYTLKVPAYMSLRGEVQASSHPDMANGPPNYIKIPDSVNGSVNFHFVWSSRMSAKLSVVAPMTNLRYVAGIEKDILINFPIKANLNLENENKKASVTVQPLYPSRDSHIFQFSTKPYTAIHNILDLNPISQGKHYKLIHIREPQTMEATVGQHATGFAFHGKYTSEQKFLDMKAALGKFDRNDAISFLLYPWAERYINYNNITLKYDWHRSSGKSATFSFSHDEKSSSSKDTESDSNFNKRENLMGKPRSSSGQEILGASVSSPSTSKPMSTERQQEFLKRASSGIRSSQTTVLDFAAEFEGHKKISYVATVAYASSAVDETTRTLMYFYRSPYETQPKNFEVCASTIGKWPKVPIMDFAKAVRANPTSYASSEIRFGENCGSESARISITAKGEQSQGRKEYIRHSPMAQRCMSLLQSGSYLQPSCRNLTARANLLDSYSINIQYERLPAAIQNVTYKAYSMARYLGYPYLEENTVNVHNKDGKISVDVDFEPDLNAVNVSLSAPSFEADFDLVRVNQYVRPWAVQHPTRCAADRFLTTTLHGQWTASCGLDRDSVYTFDNKTYPIDLGKCWHVMMTTYPIGDDFSSSSSNIDPSSKVTILARDVRSHEKEMKVILGYEEFNLIPSRSSGSDKSAERETAKVLVIYSNNPRAEPPQNIDHVIGSNGKMLANWYTLPTGEVIFEAPQHELYIMYNGEAGSITAGSSYRGDVLGLCGTYDGEASNDFTSPQNCILAEPKLLVASWAVPDQSCEGGAKEMQRQATSAPCYGQTISPHDVIKEEDHSMGHTPSYSSSKGNLSSRYQRGKGSSTSSCTQHLIKVIEEENHICFSKTPIPVCADQCHATRKVVESIPFHCVPNSSAARLYMKKVKEGSAPNFSHKETTKTIKIDFPQGCLPNNIA